MKTLLLVCLVWRMLSLTGEAGPADDLATRLQQALFDEEANRDLPAAIQGYQAVLAEHDAQRKLAATALFRLGECYRKLGRTNDATLQYQRLLREFADQTDLADQSRKNLTGMGAAPQLPVAGWKAPAPPNEEEGIIRQLQTLIRDSPDLINARRVESPPGTTRLHEAAWRGQLAVARFLLSNKVDVNVTSSGSRDTPLHAAVRAGQKAMVELLLEQGADVNVRSSTGAAPLHDAAGLGYKVIAEVLLTGKADVNAGTADGLTPLHLAAREGFRNVAEVLLDRGANIDAQDNTRTTPLLLAVSQGQLALADLLLQRGASLQAADSSGRQALHRVFEAPADKPELVELLLSRNADVNAQEKNGQTPLQLAVAHNADNLARLILSRKPDLERVDRDGLTPLQRAAMRAPSAMAKLLLEAGALPNVVDKTGMSPLHYAVGVSDLDKTELLLAHRANPNVTDNNGATPLSVARRVMTDGNPQARETASRIVDLLLKHGADENLERRDLIMVRRKDWAQPFLYRGTNVHNQHTLGELLGLIYLTDPRIRAPLSFPALNNVKIHPLALGGSIPPPTVGVDAASSLQRGECPDRLLAWGDIVEIPEADHRINEAWFGLSTEHQRVLMKCVERRVRLTAGGETKDLTLQLQPFQGSQRPPHLAPPPEGTLQAGFRLNAVLRASKMLRTSSDLSRVRVVRADPQTGQTLYMIFDLSNPQAYDERSDLWLRDRDVIEVP